MIRRSYVPVTRENMRGGEGTVTINNWVDEGEKEFRRDSLMTSVKVDGKQYSLSSLGIMTSKDYTEMGLLHMLVCRRNSVFTAPVWTEAITVVTESRFANRL